MLKGAELLHAIYTVVKPSHDGLSCGHKYDPTTMRVE